MMEDLPSQASTPPRGLAAPGSSLAYACTHVLEGHTRAVSSVKHSPGGATLATASADATLRLWDAESGAAKATLKGHAEGLSDVAWSVDGAFLASASDDKTVRLWDAAAEACVLNLEGHTSYVMCVNFSPQANLLVTGSFDENVKLWDVRSGRCLRTLPAHSDPVTAAAFNCDGSCLVSGAYDGLVRVWDTATGECLKTLFADGNPPVSYAKYSPNGRYLLAATLDGTVRLWSAGLPSRCAKTYRGHANRRFCVAVGFTAPLDAHGGGQQVVAGSEDHAVYLWNLQDRKVAHKLQGHCDAVLAVDAHPTDPHRLVSGGAANDKTVRLWRATES